LYSLLGGLEKGKTIVIHLLRYFVAVEFIFAKKNIRRVLDNLKKISYPLRNKLKTILIFDKR